MLRHLSQYNLFIKETKIAALLHDIGSLEGKEGHAKRSYEYAKKYFEQHNFHLIHEAIKEHSNGFETHNLIALVLILADNLDITKKRLAPAGYKIAGLNEIQFIESIEVSIINEIFYVHFITQLNCNQESFENFYFSKQVFKAMKSFSKRLDLNYVATLNNKE